MDKKQKVSGSNLKAYLLKRIMPNYEEACRFMESSETEAGEEYWTGKAEVYEEIMEILNNLDI